MISTVASTLEALKKPFSKNRGVFLGIPGSVVLSGRRLFEDSACSHRLRGLPSSSGSPSLLQLRALAPQKHIVSFRQGTVEPRPPPHASSVVAWPVAPAGILQWPTNPSSRFRPVTRSESLPSCQRNRIIRRSPEM